MLRIPIVCFCFKNMSAIKTYFKSEVQWRMLFLEHSIPSDFYLSPWQLNRSPIPLLILRSLIFLGLLAIIILSITFYGLRGFTRFWLIYLTHWGLVSITTATGLSVVVSARSYIYGPISFGYNFPWYAKCYWVTYNAAIPLAFLITVFYWSILYDVSTEEELNHTLDIAVHGLNSVAAFLLLTTSSQPFRLLHIVHPLILALVYVIFSAIYYAAGGTDQNGNHYIYPVVDWSQLGSCTLTVFLTGVFLVVLYTFIMALTKLRDASAKLCFYKNADAPAPPEATPLRHQNTSA